jgi:site-specific DNA recombinase
MSGNAGTPKAVGYTRTSTDEQHIRPEDDRRRIEAACVAYGYELVEFITDIDVSGKIPLSERDNGRRVHEMIEAKRPLVDILVVTNLDRLTRESADGMALIKRMVPNGRRSPMLLVSLDDHIDLTGAMGRFFAKFRVLLGEFERELIGERTANALGHKRRTGRAFSREPYGWDHTEDGRLVRNEAEQSMLVDMRALRAEGMTDHAIATRLNGAGIVGKRGGTWQANTVWRILRNADGIGAEASS